MPRITAQPTVRRAERSEPLPVALSALLFAGFVLVVYLRVFKKTLRKERKTSADSYGEIFKLLIITIIPVLVSSTIYNCNATIDQAVYKNIAAWQGYSKTDYGTWNGIYTGKYQVLINVPLAHCILPCGIECAGALCCLCERKTRRGETADRACHTLYHGRGIPGAAVGMGVLASPILQMLFGDSSELAARMLQTGSVAIIFVSLSTLSSRSAAGDESDEGADQECSDCTGASLAVSSGGADAWAGSEHFCGDHRKCMLRTDHVYSKCALDPPLQRIPSGSAAHVFRAGGFSGWNGRGGMACLPSVPRSASEQSDRNACIDCCRRSLPTRRCF